MDSAMFFIQSLRNRKREYIHARRWDEFREKKAQQGMRGMFDWCKCWFSILVTIFLVSLTHFIVYLWTVKFTWWKKRRKNCSLFLGSSPLTNKPTRVKKRRENRQAFISNIVSQNFKILLTFAFPNCKFEKRAKQKHGTTCLRDQWLETTSGSG